MSLVELADDGDIDDADRAMADSGREQYGTLLETWRAILLRPGLFSAYLPFLRAVAGPGAVDDEVKGLSALYVGTLNHCRYTVSHRLAAVRRAGVPDETVLAMREKRWDAFPEPLRVALEYTEALTTLPPNISYERAPQGIPDELLARVTATFTDEQLVELTMSISVWNALARFHRVMGFELDMPEPPPGIAPA